MYYRITDGVALRSWPNFGFGIYRRGDCSAAPLSAKQAAVMLRCDGEHDIETDETVMLLALKKMIEPCERGERPSAWSAPRRYDNAYFPLMNLMITGKCNFNCLHCFNAADHSALTTEWSFEDVCDLLDQARDCGVASFQITGGEPMAYRRFLDIVREIHRNGMAVVDINTNGHYITGELLDELQSIGCNPTMKISFDGVGFHDWMRQREGAEARALDAMRLCVDRGFDVMGQVNMNWRNRSSMEATLELLEEVGVGTTRIIRTTEVPRWAQAAGNACMTFPEYYDECLSIARWYASGNHGMELDFWQFLLLMPENRRFYIEPVKDCGARGFRYTLSRCTGNRSMVAITSDGNVVPCMQVSGLMEALGIRFANVHETPLSEVLTESSYLDTVRENLYGFCAANEKCAACPHFRRCAGGCPALGLLFFNGEKGFHGEDLSKCAFFDGSWEAEIVAALDGWTNVIR
mgnify:CR=1 FL=1